MKTHNFLCYLNILKKKFNTKLILVFFSSQYVIEQHTLKKKSTRMFRFFENYFGRRQQKCERLKNHVANFVKIMTVNSMFRNNILETGSKIGDGY